MEQKTIFSGIQPSGNLHLGNYLGAIRNWVTLQKDYNSIFCVVDLHAITVPQEPAELNKKVTEIAKVFLAAGISANDRSASEGNPKKSTIFVQSAIPQHSELMWILGTITKTGELFKMTQFKDKAEIKDGSVPKSVDAGLLNYPILMAADILIYDADLVPVGEDQLQHIELARVLARRFNDRFGETFKIPEPNIVKEGMRIMSLDDPTKKMSKSSPSKNSRIEILDSPDEIKNKIRKAVTDSGSEIVYSDDKPAIKNLLNIFSLVTNSQPTKVAENYRDKSYKEFKEDLAQTIIDFLVPFQKRYHEISDAEVEMVLQQGTEKLAKQAKQKMDAVRRKVGLS